MYYADNTTTASDSYNTALGFEALLGSPTPSANTGTNNTAVGTFALAANTSGSYNAALGMNAGQSITSGNNNIMVGEGGNITTGSSNIAIGNNLTFTSATLNSQLDIGDTIFGDLSGKKVGINNRHRGAWHRARCERRSDDGTRDRHPDRQQYRPRDGEQVLCPGDLG